MARQRKELRVRKDRGRFQTIASASAVATSGTVIVIGPGVYAEPLILLSDVTFELDGAIIDYNQVNETPTVHSNGVQVLNCAITGTGTIKRSNSGAPAVLIDNDSQVGISGVTIQGSPQMDWGAIRQNSGELSFSGNLDCVWTCINCQGGTLTASGNFVSQKDYAIFVGGGNAQIFGTLKSGLWVALGVGNGSCVFQGHALSDGWIGVEFSGGESLTCRNSILQSNALGSTETADAISKSGGNLLTLDNCQLICASTTAYSIATQRVSDSVTLASNCTANRPKQPNVTLVGPGQLIVT